MCIDDLWIYYVTLSRISYNYFVGKMPRDLHCIWPSAVLCSLFAFRHSMLPSVISTCADKRLKSLFHSQYLV